MVASTKDWLSSRPVFQHHHVSIEDDADFSRLHRFLTGRAIGFVAGGGGGFGPAHVGIFKALLASILMPNPKVKGHLQGEGTEI